MKKYYICFFILAVLLTASALTGAYICWYQPKQANPVPSEILETEFVPEDNAVINQEQVEKREEEGTYCLAAEDGFLLVFVDERSNVCPYAAVGISGGRAGKADGGHLVSDHDGGPELSGIVYELKPALWRAGIYGRGWSGLSGGSREE